MSTLGTHTYQYPCMWVRLWRRIYATSVTSSLISSNLPDFEASVTAESAARAAEDRKHLAGQRCKMFRAGLHACMGLHQIYGCWCGQEGVVSACFPSLPCRFNSPKSVATIVLQVKRVTQELYCQDVLLLTFEMLIILRSLNADTLQGRAIRLYSVTAWN